MNDLTVNSISNLRPVDAGNDLSRKEPGAVEAVVPQLPTSKPGATAPAEVKGTEAAAPVAGEKTSAKPGSPAQAEQAAPKPLIPVTRNDGVSIHFQVDSKTSHITVLIVDRASRRVLRSIPPEELNKMQVGDLLELNA